MPESPEGAEDPIAEISAEDGAGERVEERLRRLSAGEATAAAWLYDTFAPGIWKRLGRRYAYLGHPEVEDLLQDTFLLVLRDRGRLLASFLERAGGRATAAALERFLWDQACGLASNRRRKNALREVVALDERATPPVQDGERRTLDRDLLERLDACLARGAARVYLYFKLRHTDGLTPEEIAAATGWSRKATYKLRQSLEEGLLRCAEKLGIVRPR